MGRPSAGLYLGFLIFVLIVQAALLLGKGGLYLDQHEGDALHVLDILMRMGFGELPHKDFHTPLGILAFAPISWFLSLGVSAGKAILAGHVLFAALILPAVWWTGHSRLSGGLAAAFGASVLILSTALVYGGPSQVASVSMYYNRWGWAVGFLLAVLSVVPAKRDLPVVDGIVLGLGLTFLALSKVTFFVAFLPAVLLALVLRQNWHALLAGLVAGLVLMGLVTLAAGVDFWAAYWADLSFISEAPIRAQPGETLRNLLISPTLIAVNLCLLAAIVLVRQADMPTEGAVLLVLAPGFVYATYQSWGNDPKWLFVLAIILLSLRPDRVLKNAIGWDLGRSMGVVALVALALFSPSMVNLVLADLRHAQLDRSRFLPMFPGDPGQAVNMRADRLYLPAKRVGFAFDDHAIAAEIEAAGLDQVPDTLFGQPLELCKLQMGMIGLMHQIANELEALPETHGKTVFVADTFSSLWLFGSTRPQPGGAPWFYGDIRAMDAADFVLIPLCPVTYTARALVLKNIAARNGAGLNEVTRTSLYVLLRYGG